MDVGVAVQIAMLSHVDPAVQPETQDFGFLASKIYFRSEWKGLKTAPQIDNQAIGTSRQRESAIHVTSAFSQIFHVGMLSIDFQGPSFSVGDHNRGCNGLAG